MNKKFRFLTSGESHGSSLNAIIEGVPAGIPISVEEINKNLSRRQQGYGRGGRMKIETDKVEIKSGVRHGISMGSPICLEIKNKDFENWNIVMSAEEVDISNADIKKSLEEKTFTKLRPGHADYAGSVKYGFKDLRNVLERSSARKTAIEVAVGSVAQQILKQFNIEGFASVIRIGKALNNNPQPSFEQMRELSEQSEVRCWDNVVSNQMKAEIDNAKSEGNTIGGEFEVIYRNLPVGLGSFVHYDRAIDGLIAQAIMSIPAVKSVEIGLGKQVGELKGSEVHDAIYKENDNIVRKTNNAGGIEGGMTNGEPLVVRGVMKPIPTMIKPLPTVDIKDFSQSEAHFERSDTCAVPACAVVAEARVAIVLVDELLDKFGGDSLDELKAHYNA